MWPIAKIFKYKKVFTCGIREKKNKGGGTGVGEWHSLRRVLS